MSLSQLHTLLSKTGQTDNKRDLILEATNGRSSSSKDLNAHEMRSLIGKLQSLTPQTAEEASRERMRKKVIGLMKEAGYKLPGNKADMKSINEWLLKQTETPFNNCTNAELVKLIHAATQVRNHYLTKVRTTNQ